MTTHTNPAALPKHSFMATGMARSLLAGRPPAQLRELPARPARPLAEGARPVIAAFATRQAGRTVVDAVVVGAASAMLVGGIVSSLLALW